MPRTRTAATLAAAAASLALAACTPTAGTAPGATTIPDDATIIDVRTAAEHADARLDGAVLLDVSNGDLAAAIPQLDPHAPYLVYCRSGSRSAQAVALLRDAGFIDVTDLGSLEQAAATTGLEIER
ncbi:rhodanese-like domain-containing protein [Agrococcus terreus]|uniref:rhodanese-like domain-containing protein n=1 Tax=Agrococcus terreus TaxID=574649 RepID=UPI00384F358C